MGNGPVGTGGAKSSGGGLGSETGAATRAWAASARAARGWGTDTGSNSAASGRAQGTDVVGAGWWRRRRPNGLATGSNTGGHMMGTAGGNNWAMGNGCPSCCSARDFGGAQGSRSSGTDVVGRCRAQVGIGNDKSWARGTGMGNTGGVGRAGTGLAVGGDGANGADKACGSTQLGTEMGNGPGSTGGVGRAQGTGSSGMGSVGSSRAQGRSGGSGGTGGDTGTEGAGDSGAQAGIGAGAADMGGGDGTNGAGRGRAVGTISSGTGRSREGISGAGCRSRAWMASGASRMAAADSRGGNGAQGITAGSSNEACRGTDMGASSYCGYKPHIVALNSSQLDGSARASLAAAKVSSDISSV